MCRGFAGWRWNATVRLAAASIHVRSQHSCAHCGVWSQDLEAQEDGWELLTSHLVKCASEEDKTEDAERFWFSAAIWLACQRAGPPPGDDDGGATPAAGEDASVRRPRGVGGVLGGDSEARGRRVGAGGVAGAPAAETDWSRKRDAIPSTASQSHSSVEYQSKMSVSSS